MQILLIISLFIAFLAILFAVQNVDPITVRFLIWETRGSLALVLFITLTAGALMTYFAILPSQIRRRLAISNQQKRITQLEKELASTRPEEDETSEKDQPAEEK